MKTIRFHILLLIPLMGLSLLSCGPAGEFESANLKAGQVVDLKADDDTVPARLTIEEAPTSSLGTSQTVGATFEGDFDLRSINSPPAYNAIQGAAEILLELRFVDTSGKEKKVVLPPLKQGEELFRHIVRETLPFPRLEINNIIFVVDGKPVGYLKSPTAKK